MKITTFSLSVLVLAVSFSLPPLRSAVAQSNPRYVNLGSGAVGALYTPDSGTHSHVGIVVGHPTSNSLGCGTGWASRGFLALCFNTRYVANETAISWETIILDVRSAVTFIKGQSGITKVVLVGASGGGPLMTTYQAVAENGAAYCQGSNKLVECGNNVAGLPRADGIILNDSIPGYGINGLRFLDPSVLDEAHPELVNSNLDPYSVANGFNPAGTSNYSAEFKQRYHRAQANRMNRLIDTAQQRLRQAEEGKESYRDDDVFVVGKGETGPLFRLDLSIAHSTINPQKLLKNDGTISVQIVESVRLAAPSLLEQSDLFQGGARLLTLRSFLSLRAIRAKTAYDFDMSSNNNSTGYHLQHISVPLLLFASGAHYFIRDNEVHYELAASADKDFVVTEGASHTGPPCVACEQFPGQYANSAINQMNYMVSWINQSGRF
jgi:pimeloyl-ACP methyl ester carboxylesterase